MNPFVKWLTLLAFCPPIFAHAGGEKFPTPSLVFPTQEETQLPSRARRLNAFERADREADLESLDELDQDILYMRELRNRPLPPPSKESLASPPPNGKSILFFDLNFAPSEIAAARTAAAALGETLLLYPQRTQAQQDAIEKGYRETVSVGQQLAKCQRVPAADCTDLSEKLLAAQTRVTELVEKIQRLDPQSLLSITAELSAQNVRITDIVFSGHSGGTGFFMGLFGNLSVDDLVLATQRHPEIFSDLQSVLLWGCYSGTLDSLTEYWQKKLPSVKGFFGYRNRAPLGIRESSGRLLKSYLLHEAKFLAAPNIKIAHQIFRGLDLVADLDATALTGDYYYSYDQVGKVSDMLKVCQDFDSKLLDKYNCYNLGQPGCENPPANHLGPLRELYSFLQVNRHCATILQQKYGHLPTPDYIIRLIYMDTVKANFEKWHKSDFQSFADYADEIGFPSNVRLDKFARSTRAEDSALFKKATEGYLKAGMRDLTYLDRPDWRKYLAIGNSIGSMQMLLGYTELMEPCVPFSWIEPGAKETDTCGLSTYLVRPISKGQDEKFTASYSNYISLRWFKDTDPWLMWSGYVIWSDFTVLKMSREGELDIQIEMLKKEPPPLSAAEQNRLARYQSLKDEAEKLNNEDLKASLLREIDDTLAFFDREIAEFSAMPNARQAVVRLNESKSAFAGARQRLSDLN